MYSKYNDRKQMHIVMNENREPRLSPVLVPPLPLVTHIVPILFVVGDVVNGFVVSIVISEIRRRRRKKERLIWDVPRETPPLLAGTAVTRW